MAHHSQYEQTAQIVAEVTGVMIALGHKEYHHRCRNASLQLVTHHPVKIYIRLLLHDEVGVNWELTGNRMGTGFVKKF